MDSLADAYTRPSAPLPVKTCKRCGRKFVKLRHSKGGGKRDYCYDPKCENAREIEHNNLAVKVNREKRERKRKEQG